MSLSCNVGSIDRIVRFLLAVALLAGAGLGGLEPWLAAVAVVVGLVLGVTAILRFCPLYALLGVRTCRTTVR